MEKRFSENIDPRPKRRRDSMNTYMIFSTGAGTDDPHYYVSFRNSIGEHICLEIEKTLFDLFDRFELDDLSFMNEQDNHYERSEVTEQSLNTRAAEKQVSLDEMLMKLEERDLLHNALKQLTEVQRRRIHRYFFDGYTIKQIAEMENCKHPSVLRSIQQGRLVRR